MSGIWCHMSDVRRLMCDMYDVRYRCLTAPVWCHMSDVRRVMCDICMMSDVWYVCCGSILSFVQIFFSFVLNCLSYYNHTCTLPYPKTKEGKIWTKDKIEPHVCLMGDTCDVWCQTSDLMTCNRHLTSDVGCIMSYIRCNRSEVWCQTTDVCCLYEVWCLLSEVRRLMFVVRYMMSGVWCLMSDVTHIFSDEGSIAETSEIYLQLPAFNLPPSHF